MDKLRPLALTLAGLMLSVAAAAAQAADAAADPNEVVCTYEKRTGSHIKQKICATRGEREQRAREDRESMRQLKGQGSARQSPGGSER